MQGLEEGLGRCSFGLDRDGRLWPFVTVSWRNTVLGSCNDGDVILEFQELKWE